MWFFLPLKSPQVPFDPYGRNGLFLAIAHVYLIVI